MCHCFNHIGGSFLYSCFLPLASCIFPQAILNDACFWSWVNNLILASFWRKKVGVYICICICTYTPHVTQHVSLCTYSGYYIESWSTGPVQSMGCRPPYFWITGLFLGQKPNLSSKIDPKIRFHVTHMRHVAVAKVLKLWCTRTSTNTKNIKLSCQNH